MLATIIRRIVLTGLIACTPLIGGCYVDEADAPAAYDDYQPQVHDNGYVVYYDTQGSPYYYQGNRTVYVNNTSPYYNRYVSHYRTYGTRYHRWNTNRGTRYRTYRSTRYRR